ncbi:MAG: sensor histidine kinase [Bdellovibrionales bacterium]
MSENELRILLIDDDEDDFVNIRDLLREIKGVKYHLTWKSTYQTGLDELAQAKFDACLLDFRLGGHTGLELLQEAQRLGKSCPIIVLTGHGDFELDVQAMQMGAADYLVKGQITSLLLERAIRYSIKHAQDLAQILQQDRLASLGLLASSLAHEIGTPLGVISGRAELLAKKYHDHGSITADMGLIISQIERIAKLVNSLLHLARGNQSDFVTSVNLNDTVQDVLNLISHELERKNIKLDSNINESFFVRAEAGPLGQVVLNLLVNSMHAIEDAKKTGKKDEHKISIQVQNQSDRVELAIQDTGCGIAEKNLSQLFKPFFTTKDIGQGTGLGLATSLKIAQSWGGSIQVSSQEGRGAKFTVSLLKAN